jgi:hypothetical protein
VGGEVSRQNLPGSAAASEFLPAVIGILDAVLHGWGQEPIEDGNVA